MVVFFSWRKPSFLGSKTQFIFSGGILRHICFYRKSETSPEETDRDCKRGSGKGDRDIGLEEAALV
jgi:hypothetical protein